MKNKIAFICGLGVLSGIFGFVYELIFYWINGGFNQFYMRGICFGPWIDIYVIGGLLIYYLCRKLKDRPILVFTFSGVLCGLLEYAAGLLIFNLFDGKRAWDYNTEILNFGNINGFVCLRSVLFFALSGLILIYIIVPFINKLLNGKYKNIFENVFITLGIIFIVDEIYNVLIKIIPASIHSASYYYEKLGIKYWKS